MLFAKSTPPTHNVVFVHYSLLAGHPTGMSGAPNVWAQPLLNFLSYSINLPLRLRHSKT